MSVIITVIAALAAVFSITRWHTKSAFALGKVSAVVSATAVLADTWSKMQTISKRLQDNPTQVMLPNVTTASPSREVVRRDPDEDNDFYREHPSFGLTGGIRGYDAYRRP